MNKEKVLEIIDYWLYECVSPNVEYFTNRINFYYLSYYSSALEELKECVKYDNGNPIIAIEMFIEQMERLSIKGKNENADYMFSVYADAAKHILDMVL